MKYLIFSLLLMFCITSDAQGEYYLLKTYHFSKNNQGERIMDYLEDAYVPTLHGQGFKNIGVFSDITNDTTDAKKIFVLIPSKRIEAFFEIEDLFTYVGSQLDGAKAYWTSPHDQAPFDRVESSLLRSFTLHPKLRTPELKGPKKDRIYELRSYEGATEKLYRKKVEMFNEGGEIAIFDDLNFNAVFYSETLIGAHTPNLVYMTTFENMEDRNKHWDAFREAPAWKTLSAKEEYNNTVSHIDIYLLRPADFSDY